MSALSQFLGQNVKFDTSAALGSKVFIPGAGPAPLICKAGGVAHIVAPATSQVSRTWYCRDDAITTAVGATGSIGWFIPSSAQLQNPGYTCRTFWDSFSSTSYWSSTENSAANAYLVFFNSAGSADNCSKTCTRCVRAFRQVTY